MKHPSFAKDLRVGDKINGHCDGWLTVSQIKKNKYSSHGNITVYFTNGDKRTYSECDSVDAVRL